MVFKTFACDDKVVEGENYLRADYSISCDTDLHLFFKVYSGLMIAVSRPACLLYIIDLVVGMWCVFCYALVHTVVVASILVCCCPCYHMYLV